MINLEKIKSEKCQPTLLSRSAPAPYLHPLFLIFHKPPQSLLPSPLKGGPKYGEGGGNCLKYLKRGCNRKEEWGNRF